MPTWLAPPCQKKTETRSRRQIGPLRASPHQWSGRTAWTGSLIGAPPFHGRVITYPRRVFTLPSKTKKLFRFGMHPYIGSVSASCCPKPWPTLLQRLVAPEFCRGSMSTACGTQDGCARRQCTALGQQARGAGLDLHSRHQTTSEQQWSPREASHISPVHLTLSKITIISTREGALLSPLAAPHQPHDKSDDVDLRPL